MVSDTDFSILVGIPFCRSESMIYLAMIDLIAGTSSMREVPLLKLLYVAIAHRPICPLNAANMMPG